MPLCSSKDSLTMVVVLRNAPGESSNSKSNVICAIIPARTAVEVNLTNALLVEEVRKISYIFFPFPWHSGFLFPLLSEPVVEANEINITFATDMHHYHVLTLMSVGA